MPRLDDAARARFGNAMRSAPTGGLRCATCRRLMRTLVLPAASGAPDAGVEIDGCLDCATYWLDAGELARVTRGASDPAKAPDGRAGESGSGIGGVVADSLVWTALEALGASSDVRRRPAGCEGEAIAPG